MINFWQKIKKPFIVLAPMADVTDPAFRFMIAKYGKPDVMWTEFVSADGLLSRGKKALLPLLKFSSKEKPIIAQLFSSKPENMEKSARIISKLGFAGIDINMGCPDKSIERQGAGASLIKNPKLAIEIIEATIRGAGGLPVSVKTRIGYNMPIIDKWIEPLMRTDISALTIHARTRKEMSLVPANWDYVKRVVEIRNKVNPNLLIIGNGDVLTIKEAVERVKETGADGIMIGRGFFGKPWVLSDWRKGNKDIDKGIVDKVNILIEHIKQFKKRCSNKNFAVMKKHFKAYINGFEGAKELRIKLMNSENSLEAIKILRDFLKTGNI